MRKTLSDEIRRQFDEDERNRSWLEAGSYLEMYFDVRGDGERQGKVIYVSGLAIEILAMRVTLTGFRAYVKAADAAMELKASCTDT